MALSNITLNSTDYVLDKKDNHSKIEVEIGDVKDVDIFQPQVKLKYWDNETNFSIRYDYDNVNATNELKDNKVIWKSSDKKREVNLYEIEGYEDGGFEFEVILNERPSSNIINYTIQTKGFDFLYQPELTSEEIDRGDIRPENIVGSYAVYHSTKQNSGPHGDYRTGKAFHISRPSVLDFNDSTAWCDLNIDIEKELLTITIPQKFLDDAVYPVIIDPTFGNTTGGASSTEISGDDIYCFKTTPPDSLLVDIIHINCSSGFTVNFKGVSLDGPTGNVLTNGVAVPGEWEESPTRSWKTSVYSSKPKCLDSSEYYWGIISDGSFTDELHYDAGNSYDCYYDTSNNYDSPQSIGSSPSSSGNKYSIYITYTLYFPTLNYAKGPSPLSDEFNDSSLDVKWTEDYQAGGDSTESGTALFITSGADEHPNYSGVYQTVTGDFDVRMKLSHTSPDNIGSSAEVGIAFWTSDSEYMSIHRYSTTSVGYYSNSSSGNNVGWDNTTDQYFRITRIDSLTTVYSSKNNSSWSFRLSGNAGTGVGRLYIFANDDVAGGDFIAEVDWFRAEPNVASPVSMQLYATDSTAWEDVIVARVNGANWYGRLDSNLGHTYGTDLRVRQNGTTYTVLTEDND